jgi:solute carrier family 25 phosphate transporter 3
MSRLSGNEGPEYYYKAGAAGSIAAFFTHVGMVPIDVIKTRMQISRQLYPNFLTATKVILAKEGAGGLALGFGPTLYGYAAQGALKYGLYEYFKMKYTSMLGHDIAHNHASAVYLAAGMTAETIADFALTPMEAIRIKLVSQPNYARGTFTGLYRLAQEQGVRGWYKGLIPLILKQVPYTAVKFAVFEATLKGVDAVLPHPRAEYNKRVQLGLTFAAGFVGGVAGAAASHPADTLLTAVNVRSEDVTSHMRGGAPPPSVWSSLRAASAELGWSGIWRGLFPRMGMVGLLAGLQLWIYDAAKVMMFHLPVTQGIPSLQHAHDH